MVVKHNLSTTSIGALERSRADCAIKEWEIILSWFTRQREQQNKKSEILLKYCYPNSKGTNSKSLEQSSISPRTDDRIHTTQVIHYSLLY